MIQRVNVFHGRLTQAGSFLEWQVYDRDGKPVTFDYKGEAWLSGETLNIPSGANVCEFRVGQTPTPESCDRESGWNHARRQKIRRTPKNKSSAFYFGWYDCWKCRKDENEARYTARDYSYIAI